MKKLNLITCALGTLILVGSSAAFAAGGETAPPCGAFISLVEQAGYTDCRIHKDSNPHHVTCAITTSTSTTVTATGKTPIAGYDCSATNTQVTCSCSS